MTVIVLFCTELQGYCVPFSEVGRQHLRSFHMSSKLLSVPRLRRSAGGTRAFSVAGSTVWNSLPDYLRDPAVDSEQFSRDLKNSSPNIRSTALAH